MKKGIVISLLLASALTTGCQTVQHHRDEVRDDQSDRVTVGTVQKEIRVGMPASDVAAALGSPNIVTTDENRREVWIYDKLSTETAYSTSSGGVNALVLGLGAVVGAGGGSYNSSTGATSKSQRTLTVIVKFDENNKVRDFAYHTSRF